MMTEANSAKTAVDLKDAEAPITASKEPTPSELEVASWRRFGTVGFEVYVQWILAQGSYQVHQFE